MTIKQQGGVFGRHPEFSSVEVTGDLSISDKITHIGDENTSIRFPAADTMSVETAGLQRFVVMPNGNIGINNAAPSALGATPEVVMTGASATALSLNIGASRAGFMYCDGSRTLLGEYRNLPMQFRTNNAERMVIEAGGDVTVTTGNLVIGTSGKGIDFSATSGTGTSELFDDYEEGTWTPSVTSVTAGPTIGASPVYSGTYTKIGRSVFCDFSLYFDDAVTVISADDRIILTGLPFTANGGAITGAGALWALSSIGSGNNAFGVTGTSNNTSLTIYITHVDGTLNYNRTIRGTVTYFTNS